MPRNCSESSKHREPQIPLSIFLQLRIKLLAKPPSLEGPKTNVYVQSIFRMQKQYKIQKKCFKFTILVAHLIQQKIGKTIKQFLKMTYFALKKISFHFKWAV